MIGTMYYELFRFLHFAAIFGLAGSLLIENMALKPEINAEDARNLAKVNSIYGISAVLAFLFGLTLWLWVGKPSEFYSSNPLFHVKLGLFILVTLLSIYPTIFFVKHGRSVAEVISVPTSVSILIKVELSLLLVIPVLGFLMARGIGINS